ncbi:sulfite exporter TauE/SafE family protein [Rhodobacteraceae bacterium RKSG542]|uniref:sulfite exporter TauE/SafE family protein n=1 Tax=Pseudovibrio flavus TaxID=2529854 RepID=UPI0012BCDD74|nr:sulfite exporter TauE/SafE family protein [Pseudovibrio flavus]MTI19127.1 sulfite exporter TauE/SafE family protein [Pseudovibrio flavus]
MSYILACLPDLSVLVPAFIVVTIGACMQASIGMGLGMIAAPVLAVLDPTMVPGTMLVLSAFMGIAAAKRESVAIVWKEYSIGVLGRLTGTVIAGLILVQITSIQTFSLLFGVVTAVAVLLSLAGFGVRFSSLSLGIFATISGVMATITSVGAPPMAIAYQGQPVAHARPNMNAIFGTGSVLSLFGTAASGWLGFEHLISAAVLFPALYCGFALAGVVKKYTDQRFRYIALGFAFASAMLLIYRGIS